MKATTARTSGRRRGGFTLVELMVAAAVSVVIMAVMAGAFQSGTDTMRYMRSVGGMQDQLRAATEMIRHDLQADHFVARDGDVGASGQKISGAKLSGQWLTDSKWKPPAGGFFRIQGTGKAMDLNVSDGLTFPSQNATDHLIHFTSVLAGDKPQNTYTVSQGSNTLSSPLAEISYALDSQNTGATPNGTQTFKLVRRQRLAAKATADKAALGGGDVAVVAQGNGAVATFADFSGANATTFRLADNRSAGDTNIGAISSAGRQGDDILLSNVLSFEVKASWAGPGEPTPSPSNYDYPFDNIPGGVFDTGYGTDTSKTPQKIRVKALQIRVRIYDPKLKSARQVTIVQDM